MNSKGRPKTQKKSLNLLAQSFLEELRDERRLQASSLKNYETELKILLKLLESESESDLVRHLASKSPATHRRKLVIWKSFLKSCPSPWSEYLKETTQPKLRQKQPRFLTDEEAFRLESACYRSSKPARDRLFVSLGLQLGLRLNESLNLKFSDFENDWLRVLRKGGKEQRLPLTASIRANLSFWKDELKPQGSDYVFQGRDSKPMTARNAQKLITRLMKIAKLPKKISPHALRHSFATKLASNGVSLAALKELLGHQRLSTTERYLHVTPEHLRESLEFLRTKS